MGSTTRWALAAVALMLWSQPGVVRAQDDGLRPGIGQNGHRPMIGVALGGGSAKGIAHVGVLRWFEEHHIPIDRIAGTSMGGLVAGAYAAGMTPAEIEALSRDTDWDEVFSNNTYRYKDIARKQDARAYPSPLEFHLKGGLALPEALNRGQQVELILHRIAAALWRILPGRC